jgi:prepilin signal peptidase PulO-like enzyme (type II secretory pathway)
VTSAIHYATASLLIAFPLYVATMRAWFRTFREDEGRTESGLSRWLTYLVLLIASVIIVGDLIAVLFRLLQDGVTVRFLLKALTILVVAGLVFGFYTLERRKIQYHRDIPRATFRAFGWTVAGIVAAGLVLGFIAAGSPETARKRAFDMQREADLQGLAGCVERYAQELGQLPASLDVLRKSGRHAHCANWMRDPETGQAYAYRIVTPSREQGPARVGEFELCADFSLASAGEAEAEGRRGTIWNVHGAGRDCDTVTAQLGETSAPGR